MKMENLTIEDRIFILKTYFNLNENIEDTEKAVKMIYNSITPSKLFLREFIDNFNKTGSVMFKKLYNWPAAIISTINGTVCRDLNLMLRYIKESDLASPIYSKILLKTVLNIFKIKLKTPLKSDDHHNRRLLVHWYIDQKNNDYLFYEKIIFTDIAYFHLNKTVETQNGYILLTDNDNLDSSIPTNTGGIAFWCGFWSGGVIGPYFFLNDKNINDTDHYCSLLNNVVWAALRDINIDKVWYQKEYSIKVDENVIDGILTQKFANRIISPLGPISWPKRCCDLNPCVYFLWGFIKACVYQNDIQSIEHLMQEITNSIALITPEMCNDVLKDLDERMDIVNQSFGAHLSNIIYFH